MSLNFQEVRQQVKALGDVAPTRQKERQAILEKARSLLSKHAQELDPLRMKVSRVVETCDRSLRCALPVEEDLDAVFPLPGLPRQALILAADGSQISPDRHSEVEYCLVNVGAIQLSLGAAEPPATFVESKLYYDQDLFTPSGTMSEARLALVRDLRERKLLAQLVTQALGGKETAMPVITFTDGPMELWGSVEAEIAIEFKKSLEEYKGVLANLCAIDAITAGYVDKPSANPVVRLLEIADVNEDRLHEIKNNFPLRGATDISLYRHRLSPGERSAVFALQSQSAGQYEGALSLHFFYLNVGRPGHPWLARVEVPAWVAGDQHRLDALHAVLVNQCQVMGTRPYPYLLHRAHEAALVSLKEKEQVTAMISLELRNQQVEVGESSSKQASKDLSGRNRYQRGGLR
jgi:hypothetical protein